MPRLRILALVTMFMLFWGAAVGSTTVPSTAQEFPTATPVVQGTYFLPTPTPTDCREPLAFKPGDTVVLIPGIALRVRPSPNSPLLEQFSDRREFIVVEGPRCFGGFNWWRLSGHGYDGWAAEARREGDFYWLHFVRAADTGILPCRTPQSLVAGSSFLLNYNVRIRTEPTLAGLTLTVVSSGSRVVILGGPTCAEGYNWWKVRATVVGVVYDGWMAESDRFGDDIYIAEPPRPDGTICDFPLPLKIGDRARVNYRDHVPKRLRVGPSLTAPVLYDLVDGVPLEIIGGPICANSYNWWNVRVLASSPVEGWLAEGGPAQYWISKNYSLPEPTETPD